MKSFGGHRSSGAGIAKLTIGVILLLLALSAWVVAIAGVSLVRHERKNAAANGYESVYSSLDLNFTWFVIAASIFALLFALVNIIGTGVSLKATSHSAVVGLLAIVTVLDIFQTRDWNSFRTDSFYDYNRNSKFGKGIKTAFAGFLGLSVLNSLLIIVLGNSASARRRTTEGYHTNNVHDNPVVATTTTPTPHGAV